ncbi:MAG: C69 family dipeptidase [Bacteroidales bacterium]
MTKKLLASLVLSILLTVNSSITNSCTSVLVSRGASTDGSVMTSYLYDVAGFVQPLHFYPGGEYPEGDSLEVFGFRENEYLGKIHQIARTYKVIGNMNEKQVAITETTFTGREELHGGDGLFDYGNLIWITLQRASSAREAIRIMVELAETYGYKNTGETFSIADKNEAWMMDFIGKGKYGKGALWVAVRIPDGYIAAHANQSRIRQIDFDDTDNWMWAEDVVDFARERGWYEGSDEDFSYRDVYNPLSPASLLLCESRVWSVYRRAAPSENFSADYWRCVEGAEPYPLFIKPDEKISIEDMIALVRDHFHDTPYYTAEGIAAGPYKNPYRWRPVLFEIEGDTTQYSWERPISQPQTAFSFVTQSRNRLPDEIGGICWYSVDDTYSNAFMPLYMGMTRPPQSLRIGDPVKFDWDSAFWVFDLLANYAYGQYSIIIPEIKKVQKEVEDRAVAMVNAVDDAALMLSKTDKDIMKEYLTDFSVNHAEYTVQRWKDLSYYVFAKYNDRYIRLEDEDRPKVKGIGYPDEFLKRAVEERPGYYELRWRSAEESED